MASRLFLCVLVMVLVLCSLFVPSTAQVKGCPYNSIYNFGGDQTSSAHNGLLMVDHLASAFHLPSPNPYSKANSISIYGANFATAGATVMDTNFFIGKNIPIGSHNHSFYYQQFDSFMKFLDSTCWSHQDCMEKLQRAIFFVDQIGINDYKYAFLHGKSIKEVSSYVPQVNEAIKNTLREIIMAGATHVLVPGALPMGCFPGYLTLFDNHSNINDKNFKCHGGLNMLAKLHNDHLRQVLMELRLEYPHVEIVHLDYYKSFMKILQNHGILGFKRGSLMKACCGSGGRYNFDPTKMCGDEGVEVCSNPEKYVHWDGFHPTGGVMDVMVAELFSREGFMFPDFQLPEVMHCVM